MEFDCKWSPPVDDLQKLSKAYPDYLIEVVYREPGMVLYGRTKYRGGDCIENVIFTKEEYLDAYDEEYNNLISQIEEEKYDEFLKDHAKYLADLEGFYPEYSDLIEKHILKRFQDKDLPLLVGYTWIDETNSKEFERRLKEENNE